MDSKFPILIVEDKLIIAEMLREMLLDLGYSALRVARNFNEAVNLFETHKPELCFVDINLGEEKSGFDVIRELKRKFEVQFVFLTSYSDKKTVAEAAALGPQAYLLKPFTQADLFTTIEIIKARRKEAKPHDKYVLIKDGSDTVKVLCNDILWVKSENIYVEVKSMDKTYLVRNSLEKFLEELDDAIFFRAHRSYIININHVKAISGQYLLIENEKIPLSRKFRNEVLVKFKA